MAPQYTESLVWAVMPQIEEMLMIFPRLRAFMPGTTAWVAKKLPFTWTSNTRWNDASS